MISRETTIYEKDKTKDGLKEAGSKATKFITDITNGIYVHRDGDSSNGVQITDDVDVVRGGVSVIHLGDDENNDTIVRVGEANEANVEITPTKIKMGENFDVTQLKSRDCSKSEKEFAYDLMIKTNREIFQWKIW